MAKDKDQFGPEEHFPSETESFGPASPEGAGDVVRDPNFQAEKDRLDRMGVRPIEDGRRGVNIRPEAHHLPDPVKEPNAGDFEDQYGEGKYRFAGGETMQARSIHSPVVPTPPYPQQPEPKKK